MRGNKIIKKGEVRITYHGRKEKDYELDYNLVLPVELAGRLIELTLRIASLSSANRKQEKSP